MELLVLGSIRKSFTMASISSRLFTVSKKSLYYVIQARSSMVFIGQAGKKKVQRAKRAGKFFVGPRPFKKKKIMTPCQHQHHSVAIRTADTSQHEKISSPVYCQIPALEN